MKATTLSLAKIVQLIDLVSQRQGTGKLLLVSGDKLQNNTPSDSPTEVLSQSDRQWHLYFFQGHLFYATDSHHCFRRWQRALKQSCPEFAPEVSFANQPWEYQVLEEGIKEGSLNINQVKAIVQTNALEVFFELVSYPAPLTSHWQPCKLSTTPIALLPAKQVFQKAQQMWEQWQAKDLGQISPNLAPVLKQSPQKPNQDSKEASLSLIQLLNSQNTLWDIAYQLRQPAWAVTLSLLTLVRKNLVEFKEVPDLPKPVSQKQKPAAIKVGASPTPNLSGPLIACIDDSPVIGQVLEKILIPAGYRLLKITEPLQQMGILANQKPDLIFLDLVMPDANGYSLCAFLRQTPIFQKTPIIILTSRDNLINRSQAKLTGAVDFLSKPPEPKKVLQVIQKYLAPEKTPKSALKSSAANAGGGGAVMKQSLNGAS